MNYFKQIKARYTYSVILLRQMVVTDFKLRYQGSTLGYVWSLLRPLFLFVIMYEVFANFLHVGNDVPHYPVYLLTGIILWNFFGEITSGSVSAIVARGDLIRKLNFPKYILIISVAVSALINLLLNVVVVIGFMVLTHVHVGFSALWAPVFVAELFLFAVSIGFILSALFVRLRDVNYIWEVAMQAFFYATPIIYPLTKVSEHSPGLAKILMLNPVAEIIQNIRYFVITNRTQTLGSLSHHWFITMIPLAIVAVLAVVAVVLFKRWSPYFAEEV